MDTPLDDVLRQILQDLEKLGGMPQALESFCGKAHKFKLNTPLDEASIVRFEEAIGIALPDEYRSFIKHLGNGGAGPDYGLMPLGIWGNTPLRWKDEFIGDPALPFPYTPTHFPDNAYDDEVYFKSLDGAIPIADHGCGKIWWLVVSGPDAGSIWFDGRCSDQGVAPAWDTFLEWYRFWLDFELAKVEGPEAADRFVRERMEKQDEHDVSG